MGLNWWKEVDGTWIGTISNFEVALLASRTAIEEKERRSFRRLVVEDGAETQSSSQNLASAIKLEKHQSLEKKKYIYIYIYIYKE